jgi:hypothetical protein
MIVDDRWSLIVDRVHSHKSDENGGWDIPLKLWRTHSFYIQSDTCFDLCFRPQTEHKYSRTDSDCFRYYSPNDDVGKRVGVKYLLDIVRCCLLCVVDSPCFSNNRYFDLARILQARLDLL